MTQNNIVPVTESRELTEKNIVDLLFGDKAVKPTSQEVRLFIELCLAKNLNPWTKEVYLIKYDDKSPASIVVGKDAFMQRAYRIPTFDGMSAGVIVKRGDAIEYVEGAFAIDGVDTLLGGWARVFHKDRSVPTFEAVSITEYHSNKSTWRQMPLTMIRKVAVMHALREAFPLDFSGMYDASEMQQAVVSVDLVAETGQAVIPEKVTLPPDIQVSPPPEPEAGTECPLHAGEFFEFIDGFGGKPGEWKHKNGLHPDGPEPWAGKNRWCKQASKEVQSAMDIVTVVTQAPVQPELMPVAEEDKDDEQY